MFFSFFIKKSLVYLGGINMIPLMSFWPSVYNRIITKQKVYEFRRRFPRDCQKVYMYISKPVKAICGIVELENMMSLEMLKSKYENNLDVIKKLDDYYEQYRFVMEIKSIQKIRPIKLNEIREQVPSFVVPQSYLYLDNNPELQEYIFSHTEYMGDKIINDFTDISIEKFI